MQPDFTQILKVLRHEKPDRPTLFEFYLNGRLNTRLAGPYPQNPTRLESHAFTAKCFFAAGYDYVTLMGSNGLCFPANRAASKQTKSLNDGAIITDRASFDAYPWPDPDAIDYSSYGDALTPALRGAKIMPALPGGPLENVINLTGYDNLCFMLADDPVLVTDIFEAVCSRLLRFVEIVAPMPNVGILMLNDDWGFRSQTMLGLADMRKYVFPWHKAMVATAHKHGKPAVLHSCGNADEIMGDIIRDMKYDAKHSFEDAIEPIETAYEKYGRDIALLGGIDVDFMVKSTPDAIRERARKLLKLSEKHNNFALGTGNSVPEYIPDENYLAMTSVALEGRK